MQIGLNLVGICCQIILIWLSFSNLVFTLCWHFVPGPSLSLFVVSSYLMSFCPFPRLLFVYTEMLSAACQPNNTRSFIFTFPFFVSKNFLSWSLNVSKISSFPEMWRLWTRLACWCSQMDLITKRLWCVQILGEPYLNRDEAAELT